MFCFLKKCILPAVLAIASPLPGQTTTAGHKQEINAGINLPLSNFNKTHITGAGVQYAISNHRFGWGKTAPAVGWIGSAGVDVYLGKRDTEAGYRFKNGNYIHSRLLGGIISNPSVQTQVSVQAGIGWGIYQGTHALNFCSQLNGTFYLTEQWGAAVKLLLMKEKDARVLWAPGISISRVL